MNNLQSDNPKIDISQYSREELSAVLKFAPCDLVNRLYNCVQAMPAGVRTLISAEMHGNTLNVRMEVHVANALTPVPFELLRDMGSLTCEIQPITLPELRQIIAESHGQCDCRNCQSAEILDSEITRLLDIILSGTDIELMRREAFRG